MISVKQSSVIVGELCKIVSRHEAFHLLSYVANNTDENGHILWLSKSFAKDHLLKANGCSWAAYEKILLKVDIKIQLKNE